jgi:predicted transcriptional regulator YheO
MKWRQCIGRYLVCIPLKFQIVIAFLCTNIDYSISSSVSDILQNEFGEKLPDPQKKKRQRRRKKFIPVLTDLLWVTQKVNVYSIILLTMQVTDN